MRSDHQNLLGAWVAAERSTDLSGSGRVSTEHVDGGMDIGSTSLSRG